MWPWIRRWRDWAINDLWPLHRIGPKPQAMHYSYEKAGLTLVDNQPIPWNADAVLVECLLRLPAGCARRKSDFTLRLPGRDPVPAENLRPEENAAFYRLFFRFAPPEQTLAAELLWQSHVLGRVSLPVLPREEFLGRLSLQNATLSACLGRHTVACQTFVATQCRGLFATALLGSPTPLAPLADLRLRVEFRELEGEPVCEVPVQLSSSQLRAKQAMVVAALQKLPRRTGCWLATWRLEDQALAASQVRAISRQKFHASLRLSDTRFVLQKDGGEISLTRQLPPLADLDRVGPCFLVSSSETGMAGLCTLQVRACVTGGVQPPLLQEQEVLITDGPAPFAPGTLEAAELAQMSGFDLRLGARSLGTLPLSPAPEASFSGEGSFKPPPEYAWSAAAEEELSERLAQLLQARPNGK